LGYGALVGAIGAITSRWTAPEAPRHVRVSWRRDSSRSDDGQDSLTQSLWNRSPDQRSISLALSDRSWNTAQGFPILRGWSKYPWRLHITNPEILASRLRLT